MKKFLATIFLISLTSTLSGQVYFEEEEQDSTSFSDRLYFGGNFSLNLGFGGGTTFIDVSPLAGYMITENFSAGIGLSHIYFSRELILLPSNDRLKISSSTYGGRTFLRHNILEDYFAHLEFETLNAQVPTNLQTGETGREWVPGLFIGGGLFQPIFGKGGVNVTVLYNLLYDDIKSPYASAWVIRGGFTL